MKVGLMGYGKAGKAVASVLVADPRYQLNWVLRRQSPANEHMEDKPGIPIRGMIGLNLSDWLDAYPVDAIVDFSQVSSVHWYAPEVVARQIMLVTAISNYSEESLELLRSMGEKTKVLCSPNITLGINFLMLAAKLLRKIAPFADVEVVEQHFREKPEVSGTAKKIAQTLNLSNERVTSLRVGGIVGHHEVIFGFPHQTVRLTHDSIRREAFGTGAAYALEALSLCPTGFYSFDDLLLKTIRAELLER
ncbi:MAG: dihydrodipicolinate reductase [Limnohabitans sp.]|nr:dihydrodipicolinate reductase [Limnohabitans sp.]